MKAASASHNYKALVDSLVLSGLPRPMAHRGGKKKASCSLPFHGKCQSWNWQSHSSSAARRKRRHISMGKAKQQQSRSGGKAQANPHDRKGKKGSHT